MNAARKDQYFPLTPNQKGMWGRQKLYPNLPMFNGGGYFDISGPVEPERIEAALHIIVADAEALRLRFVEDGGEVSQFVGDCRQQDRLLDYMDCSKAEDPSGDALAWVEKEFWRLFEFSGPPLFRFGLAKVSGDRFLFYFAIHHLIQDAASCAFIVRRLTNLYNAEEEFAGDPVPYRILAEKEFARLASTEHDEDTTYWRARFAEKPQQLPLLAFTGQARHQRISGSVPREPFTRFLGFAKSIPATPFCLLMTFFYQIFCARYKVRDFTMAIQVSDRVSEELKNTIGYFTHALPIRLALPSGLAFGEALAMVDRQMTRDLAHRRMPPSRFVPFWEASGMDAYNALPVCLNYVYQGYDIRFGDAPGLYTNISRGSFFALMITVTDYGQANININLDYDPAQLSAETIEAIRDQFETFLSAPLDAQTKLADLVA